METRDNIFSPKSWKAWFYHTPDAPIEERYSQPEVKDAWKHVDPRRVHTGEKGILFFTFYRRHWGGLLQQVSVEQGKRYEAKVHAQAWSNHDDTGFPHPHDGRWSEGAGYDEVSWIEGSQPHNTGDKQQDAKANFTFKIGIDPTGGTDPMADSVIWGDGYHIFNGYVKQLSVNATAQANTITVFLSSKTLWTFCHTDAYFDDVTLTEIEDEPPPAYDCVTLVLPQDATPEQLAEILTLAYPDRRSFMFSNDDAGRLGGLAKLYNIPLADRQRYLDWYATKYPLTTVEFAQTSDWKDDGLLIGQCDEPWRLQRYGDGGGPTYCAKGCWLCACAMALRYLGLDAAATPLTVDAAVGPGGYNADYAMLWSTMPRIGLEVVCSTVNDLIARAHLDDGGVCFAEVSPVSLQHFVMVTRYEGNRFWMYDPWKRVACWLDEKYTGVDSWRLVQPVEAPPIPPPQGQGNTVSLHLQSMDVGWDTYLRDAKPNVVKVLASMHDVVGVKRVSPETIVVWRHVDNNYNGILDAADPHVGARRWIAKFKDSLYARCAEIERDCPNVKPPYFYVESINEVYPSQNAAAVTRAANFDIAFIEELDALNLPIKAVVFTAGIGNPHESEYPLLVPLARVAERYGSLFGYHNYFWVNHSESHLDYAWQWHAGRWTEMDKVFVQHGVHVTWFGAESGAHFSCVDGWRAPTCFDGNWDAYEANLIHLRNKIAVWNASHDNRFLGLVLFSTGLGLGWDSWHIGHVEMEKLAQTRS
jgi:hypothetical protein